QPAFCQGSSPEKKGLPGSFFYVKSSHLGNFHDCWFCEARPYRHEFRERSASGVQVVASDKRISICDGEVKYFKTDVLAAMDYYPFGASLPDRQWYASSDTGLFKFALNGKEL